MPNFQIPDYQTFDTERAWTAGIIDGDGCITMTPMGGGRRRKPVVVVDSTDMEILEELLRLWGGGLVAKRKAREHHRQAWSWRLYGADNIIAMLQWVVPYMRCATKRQRAELLLDRYKAVTPRNGYYTPELLAEREAFDRQFMQIGEGRGSNNRRQPA